MRLSETRQFKFALLAQVAFSKWRNSRPAPCCCAPSYWPNQLPRWHPPHITQNTCIATGVKKWQRHNVLIGFRRDEVHRISGICSTCIHACRQGTSAASFPMKILRSRKIASTTCTTILTSPFVSAGHAEEGGQGAFVFCMQVCCVCACVDLCVCVCICVCMWYVMSVHARMCACVYLHMYLHVHLSVYMSILHVQIQKYR